jgi:cathepsin L
MDYHEGVYNDCSYQENMKINHGVTLVGYGTDEKYGDYWTIRNHWGTSWGEKGFMRLKREKVP